MEILNPDFLYLHHLSIVPVWLVEALVRVHDWLCRQEEGQLGFLTRFSTVDDAIFAIVLNWRQMTLCTKLPSSFNVVNASWFCLPQVALPYLLSSPASHPLSPEYPVYWSRWPNFPNLSLFSPLKSHPSFLFFCTFYFLMTVHPSWEYCDTKL